MNFKKTIAPFIASALLTSIFSFAQPKPADAACNNWLCGWENATLKSQTETKDKEFTSNGFNLFRGIVLLIVLGCGIGALVTRDEKEKSANLLNWMGGITVVALFFNVFIGYVYGDGKGTTQTRLNEKIIAKFNHGKNDKV